MFSASKTAGPSGYNIANSLRFRSSASAYLNRTPSVAGNRQTFTWSGWVKKAKIATNQYVFGAEVGGSGSYLFFTSSDTLQFYDYAGGSYQFQLITTQVFRDPSAWYHIVLVSDTTQATAANRIRLYVNGAQITAFGTSTYPSQNYSNSSIDNNNVHYVGYTASTFDGYLADINFIDGQALTPSSFGVIDTLTGVWKPIAYSGSYGTNGFHLNFSNGTSTTTLGYDSSGNGNNWTTNNISLTAGSTYDWMIDSPTKFPGSSYGVGNYCVLSPIDKLAAVNAPTSANLKYTTANTTGLMRGTIGAISGKWYYEATFTSTPSAGSIYVGIKDSADPTMTSSNGLGSNGGATNEFGYAQSGVKQNNGLATGGLTTLAAGDILNVAYDLGAGKIWFGKNGTWFSSGDPAVGANPMYSTVTSANGYSPAVGYNFTFTDGIVDFNFGQRPFAYTPPSGYKSLCTQNLPVVTIQNGAQYMAATTYTGTGSSVSISNAVNGVGFQPDFVWGKLRTTSSYHRLSDSVRGASLTLATNVTDAEVSGNGLVSFDASGFSMNSSTNINQVYPYVAWQWKAGGTAVTNTAGSITSSVSANTTAGFSVVTYTGTGASGTVGHGLGATPAMVIVKNRGTAGEEWRVWHQGLSGGTYQMRLNSTAAQASSSVVFTALPTSTVINIGSDTSVSQNGVGFVAYCFAAILGYSAFGSYTGNGSTDGPFVYCGFRPRYLMIKRTDSTGAWEIYDTSRSPYNVTGAKDLQADSSAAEGASGISLGYDILSNGFKNRDTTSYLNASGGTYIYACFAESPFQLSLAR